MSSAQAVVIIGSGLAGYNVARELRIVRKYRPVADDAVVRNVGVGKEKIAVADQRVATVLRGAGVDGREFSEDVVVADCRRGRLAGVLSILRDVADGRELEQVVARAEARAPVSTTCGPMTVSAPTFT
jgi:hypothetical protein